MSRKKKSKTKDSGGFKSAPPQTIPASIEGLQNFESSLARRSPPDAELERKSWLASITVKNAAIATLIASIFVPLAIEIVKARLADAPSHQTGELGSAQPATIGSTGSSPVSVVPTMPTPQGADSKVAPMGAVRERSNQSESNNNKKLNPNSSPLVVSYLKQARFQYHRNQYQEALVECEKALSVEPRNQAAITLRKQIHAAAKIMSENDKPNQ